jgi:hypothetical protein
MSQKAGNNVKPPAGGKSAGRDAPPNGNNSGTIEEQYHGENTKAWQEDKKVGQHNGNGRPPLMKK